MKIVHISAYDNVGGASIACLRHAEAMRQTGVDVSVVVANKLGRHPYVISLETPLSKMLNWFYRTRQKRTENKAHFVGTFSLMRYGHSLHRIKEIKEADAVFLHWVNANTLSVKGIERILKLNKPVYWYMHDMFPITGGCHHSLECTGYTEKCLNCPMIGNKSYTFFAEKQLNEKIKHWSGYDNLFFVTPSNWLSDCVSASRLGRDKKTLTIRNVIDTDIFKPLAFNCKSLFGLDPEKRTVLIGAVSLNSIYKGFIFILDLLPLLDPSKYELLIIGECDTTLFGSCPLKIVQTGYLVDDISLTMAYNACDTFVISSVAENYPNVVLEAMACGRPCVGFNTGGIPELIDNGVSGFVTQANCAEELARCLDNLFADGKRYQAMSKAARDQIVKNNSYQNVRSIHYELDWASSDVL